jgi:hypothetical protein
VSRAARQHDARNIKQRIRFYADIGVGENQERRALAALLCQHALRLHDAAMRVMDRQAGFTGEEIGRVIVVVGQQDVQLIRAAEYRGGPVDSFAQGCEQHQDILRFVARGHADRNHGWRPVSTRLTINCAARRAPSTW